MEGPLEISFRGMEKTGEYESLIEEKVTKLRKVCDYLVSCRVAVEKHHVSSGNPFRVRVEVGVPPGHRIVGTGGDSPGVNDLGAAIREAFEVCVRQLRELVERQREDVKRHPEQETQAVVDRLYEKEGYGFLRTTEGEHVYFHRNSVLNDGFEQLKRGSRVRYSAAEGEKGRQATAVQLIEQPRPT